MSGREMLENAEDIAMESLQINRLSCRDQGFFSICGEKFEANFTEKLSH